MEQYQSVRIVLMVSWNVSNSIGNSITMALPEVNRMGLNHLALLGGGGSGGYAARRVSLAGKGSLPPKSSSISRDSSTMVSG